MRREPGVWVIALLAVLSRCPSLLWPLRPDEAGFLLVARSWQPMPDSVYGAYFVDRPPQVIALMGIADSLGGPYAHRMIGALGCGVLVLASAAVARELAQMLDLPDPRRVAFWTALVAGALVANSQIDAPAAKGELFGIPLVMLACWLFLRAVRLRSWRDAFVGGLLGVSAVGMKQNIIGGLIFGALLLIMMLVARRLPWRDFLRLGSAAACGIALPVVSTVAWAVWVGIRLETLWFTVVSFRSDASAVIASQDSSGAASRISVLLSIFVGTGMALLLGWILFNLPRLLRRFPIPTIPALAMLAFDLVGIVLSGSYWTPYLFVPIPGFAALAGCILVLNQAEPSRSRPRVSRGLIATTAAVSVLSVIGWTVNWWHGLVPVEYRTGQAIRQAARPGDTLVVYGGRADIQWASGRASPYAYLWSLPMRTLDPQREQLRELLTGRDAPTWVVEAVSLSTWSELGTRPIERSLLTKYEFVERACDRYRVYHLNTVNDVDLDVDCKTPFRTIFSPPPG